MRSQRRAERSRKEGFPPGELRGVPQRQMPATGNPSSPYGDASRTALAPVEATGVAEEKQEKNQ
ncbi:MAG: hypothetical protein PUP91_22810 [Rhizonema sp. PD37]|nr:hypothetical protein [Rhizonema sp. PD37]